MLLTSTTFLSRRSLAKNSTLVVRLFLEAVCAQNFVAFSQKHGGQGTDTFDDDEDDADDHANNRDDPVAFMKTAKILRGRVRPQHVSLANRFRRTNLSDHVLRLARVAETIRGSLGNAGIPDGDLGSALGDFAPPSVRPHATLGWFEVRPVVRSTVHDHFTVLFVSLQVTVVPGASTDQAGFAQIVSHIGLFSGAADKYELDNRPPLDSDAALLTKELVDDSACFRVADVSKLGLLLFGDVPITRIIKDSWVDVITNMTTRLRASLYDTVRRRIGLAHVRKSDVSTRKAPPPICISGVPLAVACGRCIQPVLAVQYTAQRP